MRLPDDLAAVFTSRAPSPRRSRSNPVLTSVRSGFREVGVILQQLGSVSTEELEDYLSSPSVDSCHPTEIIDYGDFDYDYDFNNFDDFDDLDEDFDDNYEDDYTPLFLGIFMADNETEEQHLAHEANEQWTRQEAERLRLEQERQTQEQARLLREQQEHDRLTREVEERRQRALASRRRARELIGQQDIDGTQVFRTPQQNAVAAITLLDTLLTAVPPDNVANILNQTKTMIVAMVPVSSGSIRTPIDSRVPPLRSQDYHQPSLSIAGSRSHHEGRDHQERSVHSPANRHRIESAVLSSLVHPAAGNLSTYVIPSIAAVQKETRSVYILCEPQGPRKSCRL